MATDRPTVGVLALQGNFSEHVDLLHAMGVRSLLVRAVADLEHCSHLIIPGGESTTISLLLASAGLDRRIAERVQEGTLAVLGICAGAILLARDVTGKRPPATLHLLDMTIDRNAYGNQLQSFDASLLVSGIDHPVCASFIRAPVITRIGPDVDVLSVHEKRPVFVRQGRVWALTCHPEMRDEQSLHQLFVEV